MLKKIEGPKKTNPAHYSQWSTSGSCATSDWDPSCFPDSHGVSQNMGCPSGSQNQSLLTLPQYDSHRAETSACCGQSTLLTRNVPPGGHGPPVPLIRQRTAVADSGIGRFMPRTTHLQERKRRREEGNKFALIETNTDNTEVIIGPQLPEIPKVDMDDDSLNTSAMLIRNKLEEVWILKVLISHFQAQTFKKSISKMCAKTRCPYPFPFPPKYPSPKSVANLTLKYLWD